MFFIKDNKILETSTNKDIISEGVVFGYGVFETIKIRNKKAIFLKEHLYRLRRSLKKIAIGTNIETKNIKEFIDKLLIKNDLNNCAIKIVVLKNGKETNTIITSREYSYSDEIYSKGFYLLNTEVRKSTTSIIPTIKSTNYMENIIERNKAISKGYDDTLFYNDKNNLAETSIGNIFLVKNKTIYTPDENQGLLKGIVRQKILEILKLEKMDCIEGKLDKEDLYNSDEIFITNSLMGVMPVTKVNDKNYNLSENSLTDIIRKKYLELEEKYD